MDGWGGMEVGGEGDYGTGRMGVGRGLEVGGGGGREIIYLSIVNLVISI